MAEAPPEVVVGAGGEVVGAPVHRADEVQLAGGRPLVGITRLLRWLVGSANHGETLTGLHAVAAQLGEQLGRVFGNGQVSAVGGAHDQQGTERSR